MVSDSDAAAPVFISAENAFSGAQDGELVRIEGTLMGRYWAEGQLTLLLSSEKALFSAMLPAGPLLQQEGLGSAWAVGSTVAVTGVFAGKVDPRETTRQQGVSRLESFQILLRSPADIAVVHTPTWWNSRHALIVLESLALLIVGILGWVLVLRHQVHQQTSIDVYKRQPRRSNRSTDRCSEDRRFPWPVPDSCAMCTAIPAPGRRAAVRVERRGSKTPREAERPRRSRRWESGGAGPECGEE